MFHLKAYSPSLGDIRGGRSGVNDTATPAHGARRLVNAGLLNERPHVQFVMGVKNALPADEHLLDIMLNELRRILPKATWTAAGIGINQARVMEWVLARGGDGVRTGLE